MILLYLQYKFSRSCEALYLFCGRVPTSTIPREITPKNFLELKIKVKGWSTSNDDTQNTPSVDYNYWLKRLNI